MQYVENQTFYHLQKKYNGLQTNYWEKGQTFFIGREKNRFFQVFEHMQPSLKNLEEVAGHHSKLIRELIFEEVRKEFFPSHPSRKKGLWVISNNDGAMDYWKKELDVSNQDRLLQLKLTGKIHIGNERFTKTQPEALNTTREKAFHYWNGTESHKQEECEILFEGFAEVIEIQNC